MSKVSSSKASRKRAAGVAVAEEGAVYVRADIGRDGALLKEFRRFPFPGKFSKESEMFDFLKTSFKTSAKNLEVSLSLPDTIAKTSMLEFEELPANARDMDEVIKWKSAKGVFLKPDECSIDYRIFEGEGKKRVLSVVVKREIIEGYEDMFLELGAKVQWISIHSFNIFNLFSERFGHGENPGGNFVFLVIWKNYFSMLVFKEGILDFYRCKEARKEAILAEVAHTFTFYTGKNPDGRLKKVYLLSAGEDLTQKLKEITEITVEPVSPDSLFRKGEILDIAGADPLDILCAAGAVVSP